MMISFQYILYTIWIINIFISLTIISLERRRPEKTLAWLLVFILLPPIGLILYIFLGRNWKIHKLSKGISTEMKELIYPILKEREVKGLENLITLIANNSDSPIFTNNEVTIFQNGVEKFQALKREIAKAKDHIHLEYYIVKDDGIGGEIKDLLILKAKEGVKVRFIIDKVGSIKLSKSYIKDLKNGGVNVVQYSYFLAPILKLINTQINYRNHRKIVVIDGKVGFLGGINIGDEYLNKGTLGYWRDTHMMVKGDFVLGLQSTFLDDFLTIEKANNDYSFYDKDFNSYFPPAETQGTSIMQIVKSGPDSPYSSIMQGILKLIYLAKDHIFIATPYFVPTESIMEALKIAILSGVKVKILVPSVPDHIAVFLASKTYLAELLDCGAEIYTYTSTGFLHCKVITADGTISSLGTANMDIRSFELNYEINSIIYDPNVSLKLEDDFLQDLKNSTKIDPFHYSSANRIEKLAQGVARIFSSLL